MRVRVPPRPFFMAVGAISSPVERFVYIEEDGVRFPNRPFNGASPAGRGFPAERDPVCGTNPSVPNGLVAKW